MNSPEICVCKLTDNTAMYLLYINTLGDKIYSRKYTKIANSETQISYNLYEVYLS